MGQQQRVSRYKTKIRRSGKGVDVTLYRTKVVSFTPKKVVLNSGGWQTSTTKTRMNQASNQYGLGYHVFQRNFQWYVRQGGKVRPFHDYMELKRR